MLNMQKKNSQPCCPKFDPKPWENTQHLWKDKLFIKGHVAQIFHIPLNMNSVMSKLWKQIEKEKASPDTSDFLMLAYDPSPWESELYMSVTKEIENAENSKISGTFISKVFDGPYNAVPKWIEEFDEYLKKDEKIAKKYYFYYTTCPKCAKEYGHNYVVAFAQVE